MAGCVDERFGSRAHFKTIVGSESEIRREEDLHAVGIQDSFLQRGGVIENEIVVDAVEAEVQRVVSPKGTKLGEGGL